jgi:hypothetical protein
MRIICRAAHTCDPSIEDHVFLYALALTASGWVGNMLSGILINWLGKRNLYGESGDVHTSFVGAAHALPGSAP